MSLICRHCRGDSEVLRDEITLLAHKAALAGVRVKHEMYVDQVHVFQSFPFLDAATVAFRSIAKFAAAMRDAPRQRPDSATINSAGLPTPVPEGSVSRSSTPTDIDTVASEMEHGKTKLVKSDGTEIDICNAEDETPDESAMVPRPKLRSGSSDTDLSTSDKGDAGNIPSPKPSKPMLRRAFSSFSRGATPPAISTVDLKQSEGARTTGHSPVDHMMGGGKTLSGSSTMRSTRRSRRPTLSAQLTLSPAKPTTRLRSQSHADMVQLISTYSAGAANQTTVYTPAAEQTFDFPTSPTGNEPDGLQLNLGDRK